MPKPKRPVHVVCWRDASKYDDLPRVINISVGSTVGFLLENSKEKVLIAQELFDDGDLRNIVCIPQELVMSVKLVGRVDVPK